jgi:hypothetical protein
MIKTLIKQSNMEPTFLLIMLMCVTPLPMMFWNPLVFDDKNYKCLFDGIMNTNPIKAILRFLYEEIILFWTCHESHVKNEKPSFYVAITMYYHVNTAILW